MRAEELRKIRETYLEEIENLQRLASSPATNEERKAFADLQGALADLAAWDASDQGRELRAFDLLFDALPDVEECEQFNHPKSRQLSRDIRALLREIDPESGV
ncbi:MAG: hypothetical protein RL563_2651 [Pseudomonadota bacterium]|jgi:hypothetical protein